MSDLYLILSISERVFQRPSIRGDLDFCCKLAFGLSLHHYKWVILIRVTFKGRRHNDVACDLLLQFLFKTRILHRVDPHLVENLFWISLFVTKLLRLFALFLVNKYFFLLTLDNLNYLMNAFLHFLLRTF